MNHLIEALFGSAPFASETLEELQLKVLDGKPIEVCYFAITLTTVMITVTFSVIDF